MSFQFRMPSQRDLATSRHATELLGVVDRIVWCSDDNSFVIAVLRSGESVKGSCDGEPIEPSVAYRFLGRWEESPRHGKQFAFSTFLKDTPLDANGVIKYLSEECPGIGKRRASDIWVAFGSAAIDMVRKRPDALVGMRLLSEEQAKAASDALNKLSAHSHTKIDLAGLFAGRGFYNKLIPACIRKWGARAPEIIRRDPFKLLTAKMPSAGFKRVDRLYLDLGNNPARLKRQFFCLWNELRGDSNGHTWVRVVDAVRSITESCGKEHTQPLKAAKLGKRCRWLSSRKDDAGTVWIAEAEKARAEWRVSESVRRLQAYTNAGDDHGNTALMWPQGPFESLSPHQAAKIAALLTAPLAILAGSPGTGKTYSSARIIRAIVETHGAWNVLVVAPTGKAAVRITQAMREYSIPLEATTIHRALQISRNGHDGGGWGFERNRDNPLPHKFVIVDECSMIDTNLAADLLEACATGAHVLWIGDPYQLPPVGHGAPLRDLIASGAVPVAELSEIQRNAGQIVRACHAIKDGKRFETTDKYDTAAGRNLKLVETTGESKTLATLMRIIQAIKAGGKTDPVWDTQVICAVNEKSELGRKNLNRLLQAELNTHGYRVAPNPFRVDDKIICLKNCSMPLCVLKQNQRPGTPPPTEAESYKPMPEVQFDGSESDSQAREEYVANGEIGRVIAVSKSKTVAKFTAPDRLVLIRHGKIAGADKDTASDTDKTDSGSENGDASSKGPGCDFDLAYSVTCHKMQGSEAPVIILPIDTYAGAKRIATREWFYTAISRARSLCVLIGNIGTLEAGCKRVSLQKRKTFLVSLLSPRPAK